MAQQTKPNPTKAPAQQADEMRDTDNGSQPQPRPATTPARSRPAKPAAEKSPALAPRLVFLRDHLTKTIASLEKSCTKLVRPLTADDKAADSAEPKPNDLIGLVGVLEGKANHLAELAHRFEENVGEMK